MIFVMGAQSACQQTFIALGQAKVSLFLALLRKIVLLIPLIYLIPMFFTGNEAKLFGVFLAEPCLGHARRRNNGHFVCNTVP